MSLVAGYTYTGGGSVMLDFGAGVIRHQLALNHEGAGCGDGVSDQLGHAGLWRTGIFVVTE